MRPTTAAVVAVAVLGPSTCAKIVRRLATASGVLILGLAALVSTLPTLPEAQHDMLSPAGKVVLLAAVVWVLLRGVAWVLDAASGA